MAIGLYQKTEDQTQCPPYEECSIQKESEMSGSNTIRPHQVRAQLQRGESTEASLKLKPVISQSFENSTIDKTVPKCAPRELAAKMTENFLIVRSLSEEEDIFHEKPRRIHKEK